MTPFSDRTQCALPARGHRPSPAKRQLLWMLAALAPVSPALAADERFPVDPHQVVYESWSGAGLRGPLGIAVDGARGEVLVANTNGHRVEIYDLDGFPIGAFTHVVDGPTGTGLDGCPKWLAVDSAGRILVVDQLAPYVDVVDYAGRPVGRLTLPAPDDVISAGGGPGAVTVARDGRILVASRGDAGRIHEFDADYAFVRAWGDSGTAPGRLSRITGLGETPEGDVLVTCVGTELAVQTFDADGQFIRGHGRHDVGSGNFSFPSGIAVTADGRVWVSDEIRQIVQVFDAAGSYLGAVGGPGRGLGEFLYPSAVATDGHDLLAVAERGGNRFQILKLR